MVGASTPGTDGIADAESLEHTKCNCSRVGAMRAYITGYDRRHRVITGSDTDSRLSGARLLAGGTPRERLR